MKFEHCRTTLSLRIKDILNNEERIIYPISSNLRSIIYPKYMLNKKLYPADKLLLRRGPYELLFQSIDFLVMNGWFPTSAPV